MTAPRLQRRDVTGDLRSAIRDAIDNATCTHAGDYIREHGIHIDACTECEVDAVVAVVEPRLWRARNVVNGRCRYCGTATPDDRKSHRMSCRHYVGPLEHHWTGSRLNITFGGALDWDCTCGGSTRVAAGLSITPICPDVDRRWRGPRSEEAV